MTNDQKMEYVSNWIASMPDDVRIEVMTAYRHYLPQPINIKKSGALFCPSCDTSSVGWFYSNYCPICGQKIYWNTERTDPNEDDLR